MAFGGAKMHGRRMCETYISRNVQIHFAYCT